MGSSSWRRPELPRSGQAGMGTSFAGACLSAILAAAWSADSSGAAELLALMVTVGYPDRDVGGVGRALGPLQRLALDHELLSRLRGEFCADEEAVIGQLV
jgi:hypothetical protein